MEEKTIPAWLEVPEAEEPEAETPETPEEVEEEETPAAITDEDVLKALENPSDAVKAHINSLVAMAVKKALAGATPRRQSVKSEILTKEEFQRMSYAERENLFNTNRNLYEKMKGAI